MLIDLLTGFPSVTIEMDQGEYYLLNRHQEIMISLMCLT